VAHPDVATTDSPLPCEFSHHRSRPQVHEDSSQPLSGSGQQKKGGDSANPQEGLAPRVDLNTQLGLRLAVANPPTKNISFPVRKRVRQAAHGRSDRSPLERVRGVHHQIGYAPLEQNLLSFARAK
jgi:hypothetical protein